MGAREPTLSVIIVTWNVRELTLACLAALRRELGDLPAEVLLVDNASEDGTVEAVREAFPHVQVIANAVNAGFPAANNQALRLVRGEYVLFLNPDTEVGAGTVRACMSELERDRAVGVVGCRLMLEDGTVQLECARHPYLLRHLIMELIYLHMLFPHSPVFGHHRMSYWDHTGVRDVEAVSGAFMLARTAVARAIGGLPEEVFMYHEDLAFCLRVRRAGWRIRFRGDVETLHRWRGSSRQDGRRLALLEAASKLQLIREGQGKTAAAAARVVFAVRAALRLVIAAVGALAPGHVRQRHPRVFDIRGHAIQLMWCVTPFLVTGHASGSARAAPILRSGSSP